MRPQQMVRKPRLLHVRKWGMVEKSGFALEAMDAMATVSERESSEGLGFKTFWRHRTESAHRVIPPKTRVAKMSTLDGRKIVRNKYFNIFK